MVQKRLPGKDWEYMVYNLLDQVIFTQDGNQRIKSPQDWSFIKYDALGRVIMTGTEGGHTETRQGLQDYITTTLKNASSGVTEWEIPSAAGTHGYTNTSFPTGPGAVALTVNYYDSYNTLAGYPGYPTNFTVSGNSTMTTGLITASKTAVLNNPSDYLWTVHYYDDKGRETQLFKQHYLGGTVSQYNYDQITNTYNNITSELTTSKREHYVKNANNTDKVKSVTILNTYAYDHMGRKVQTKEQINSGANILLSQTDYNEIGQVQTKHLHGATGAAPFMQNIAYAYNERGWLKSSTSPLFAMQLTYNNGNTAPFNGNISNQTWQIQGGASKSYNYTYDALNRLTAGISNENYNEQGIDYDLAGNIQHLTRQNSAYTYNYTGNQLQSVSGLTTGTYQYDPNGNVKFDARNQKTIAYNLLNLPQSVTATGFNLSYTYDAAGKKLRKNNGATITDYIEGIQYENGNIIFIQTEEGRAINSGGNYIYEYTLTDHLGNNRLSFDQNSATAIRQQDDYYPFGMEISRGTTASPKNEYLYNKKELQEELGQYDYGARFYDPVIGRWGSVDPLTEKMRRHSPYNYGFNNPMRFLDPDGMVPGDFLDQQGNKIGTNGIDDKKYYVVSNQNEINKISTTNSAGGTTQVIEVSSAIQLPSEVVRDRMVAAVDRSNSASTEAKDTKGGMHEEGGVYGKVGTKDVALDSKPGMVYQPGGKGLGVNPLNTTGSTEDRVGIKIEGTYHVHPKGDGKTSFVQPPSSADLNNAGYRSERFGINGSSYVLGAGNNTIYIYKPNGASGTATVVATFPLDKFRQLGK